MHAHGDKCAADFAREFASWMINNQHNYTRILTPKIVMRNYAYLVHFTQYAFAALPEHVCHCGSAECKPAFTLCMRVVHSNVELETVP
jgi:hypothetical protein